MRRIVKLNSLVEISFQIWNHYDVYREGYLEKKQLRVSMKEVFN